MRQLLTFMLLVVTSFSLHAQEKKQQFYVNGYIKNLHQFSFIHPDDSVDWTTIIHNRINLKWIANEHFSARVEMRNRLFYGDQIRHTRGYAKQVADDNGIVNVSWLPLDEQSAIVSILIDRAMVNYNRGKWDITLGRQRINWGVNLAWNPNDIFNTYNFLDFDYEERPGSDALRIQYNITSFRSFEIAAKKGNTLNDQIIAALYKFNKNSYDIQLLGGIYQKDITAGAGWAGNLKDAGFKGELNYFHPMENVRDSSGLFNGAISVDYTFSKGYYVNASVLYNHAGSNDLSKVYSMSSIQVSPKSIMPFKQTYFVQVSKNFSPIFSASLNTIYSPSNNVLVLFPNLNFTVANNWDISLIGQSFFADFAGKYQTLGHNVFARAKWSF